MSRETTQICDRCGFRAEGKPDLTHWLHIDPTLARNLGHNPVQEGDLCPGCVGSLKEWWKN